MTAVDGGISNLIQGVSQQSARDRREGQCTLQENMSSDIVRNLSRRPPTQFISTLMSDADEYQWMDFDLGGSDLYWVALKNSTIRVFEATTGAEQTVNATGTSYLDGAIMSSTLVDGTMYLANSTKTVALLTDTVTPTYGALVQVLGGQYGRTFEVVVADPNNPANEIAFSYTTPDGSAASHITNIATDYIAEQLETAANGITAFTDDYSIERKSDVLHIQWANNSAGNTERIEITTKDGEGGALMVALSDRVDSTGKLPRLAPSDYTVKVTGLDTAEEDDVYFKFSQEKAGFGNEGVWVETVAPGTKYKFDLSTMPHTLVKEDNGDFTFEQGDWVNRRVGDDNTNPEVSIIGTEIMDMGAFQGRLVMLTDNRVLMSRTNKPLDLWKVSATTNTPDDRIDLGSTAKNARNMRYLVPHNRDLVIFADKAQFIVFGRNSLTSENASIVLTTEFQVELDARPAPSGRNVFFPTNYGTFTGIREFYTEGSADINDSRPTTAHVNKYLTGTASRLTSSSNFDVLAVQTQTQTELYMYQFLWSDQEKLQSSWSKWIMPDSVVFTYFQESTMYLIMKANSEYRLCKLDLDVQNDTGLTYAVTLDYKEEVTSPTATYTVTGDASVIVAVQGAGCPNPGMLAEIESRGVGTVTLKNTYGDSATVFFGVPYTSRYRPTMPLVKDRKGIKIGTGSLTVSNFYLSYADTGSFKTKIVSPYSDDVEDYFSGRIAGDPNNRVGEQPITRGQFIVYCGDDADIVELEVYSDDHTPFSLLDIEWDGQWNKRGKRIG